MNPETQPGWLEIKLLTRIPWTCPTCKKERVFDPPIGMRCCGWRMLVNQRAFLRHLGGDRKDREVFEMPIAGRIGDFER